MTEYKILTKEEYKEMYFKICVESKIELQSLHKIDMDKELETILDEQYQNYCDNVITIKTGE